MGFYFNTFSFFAPGLLTPEDFKDFFSGKKQIDADLSVAPPIDFVPAMQRRKLSQLIKMTLYVAEKALLPETLPSSVYASRFGEWGKTFKQIEKYHAEHAVSPAGFGLTVHNAAIGYLAMLKNNTKSYTATAAGKGTFDAGLLESLSKLEREEDLLFICADEQIPDFYKDTFLENLFPLAIACTLSKEKKSENGIFVSVSFGANPSFDKASYQDHILDFIRFLLFPEISTFSGKHFTLRKDADAPFV